jgi:outer membrane protein
MALAEDGNWLVRSRLIFIAPDDDADGALGELDTEVDDDFTVEVDVTYFVTPHFAIEGILATAAHEVEVDSESAGSVNHAPATFTAQYHFLPEGTVRPYIGAGINYTSFYSESGVLDDLDLDSGSLGLAGQAGVDFVVGKQKKTVINLDLKYIDIDLEVKDSGTDLGTVDINPFIVGVGFGYRF